MNLWTRSIVAIFISITPVFLIAEEAEDSISAGLVQSFISTINENKEDATKKYIKDNFNSYYLKAYPIEGQLDFANQLHAENGDLRIESISRLADTSKLIRWSAIVSSERTEMWNELTLYFSTNKPNKITGMGIKPASLSSISSYSKNISERALKRELKSYVGRAAEKDVFSGSVLLAKNDKVIFSGTAGLADKRFGIPNKIKTKFNLASMNKMFTAVATLQLIEQGKLNLDDYLNKFIDESWLPLDISQKIQVKHLLSHTSGLGGYFNSTYEGLAKDSLRNLEDYKVLIKGDTLKFEPGTAYSYSNTGMLLLGLVIEKASGEDYFEYIRKHIYLPAGMNNSDSYDLDEPTPNLATGYYFSPTSSTGWKNNNFLMPVKGCPAGGGVSTVEDLHKFALALNSNVLLQKEYTEQLFVVHSELNSVDYGYGFQISGEEGRRIVGHNGGFSGVSTSMDIYLDQGYIAIVLSNYSTGAAPLIQKMRLLIAQAANEK